jgi:glutamyl-tRNA synthetase
MVVNDKYLGELSQDEIINLIKSSQTALASCQYDAKSLQQALNSLLETTGQKPAVLFSIIRLAVSWAPFSPALNETLAVLGPDKVNSRLQLAIDTRR